MRWPPGRSGALAAVLGTMGSGDREALVRGLRGFVAALDRTGRALALRGVMGVGHPCLAAVRLGHSGAGLCCALGGSARVACSGLVGGSA